MELAPNVGILSPQMIAAVYARSHSFARTYAFFEELCGNITLSETGYTEWLAGMRPTEEEGAATLTDESPYYVCEPALSPYGLRNWLGKVANVSRRIRSEQSRTLRTRRRSLAYGNHDVWTVLPAN